MGPNDMILLFWRLSFKPRFLYSLSPHQEVIFFFSGVTPLKYLLENIMWFNYTLKFIFFVSKQENNYLCEILKIVDLLICFSIKDNFLLLV